ncbi:MAG: glycosyl transferase, partial [Candidatus Shapirobacteria bacterium]
MKYKIYLILILVLAIFLRFVKLGNLPNSYTPDELAQGYSAYSILNTSKDEWGSSNWLNLRSFGDYKPPLQTLLMIPSIKVFGLTPFAVRFPNAFLSIFTILLTYLIAN